MPASYRTYPPDLFTPREWGPEKRAVLASVLDRMAEERHAWLDRMRAALIQLCRHRVMIWGEGNPEACVTGDDAQRLEKTRPDLALPKDASRNLFGVVFRAPGWVHSEYQDHVSTTPVGNGNLIYRWWYVGRRAP